MDCSPGQTIVETGVREAVESVRDVAIKRHRAETDFLRRELFKCGFAGDKLWEIRESEAVLLFRTDEFYRGKAYGAQMDGDYAIIKTMRKALA